MKELDNPILGTMLPPFLFEELKKIINKKNKPHHPHLAGNIVRAESFREHMPIFQDFFNKTILMYSPFTQGYIPQLLRRRIRREGDKIRIEMVDFWVNHMKQYEFNPLHNHEGCFSFIIFVKVPFKIEEMHKIAPGAKSNRNLAGAVTFVHQGSNTTDEFFTEETIFPDERWEGKCLIFPSSLHHLVHPFYGTEEARITVSGNIYIELIQA
jgi:hypothetical protein